MKNNAVGMCEKFCMLHLENGQNVFKGVSQRWNLFKLVIVLGNLSTIYHATKIFENGAKLRFWESLQSWGSTRYNGGAPAPPAAGGEK